MDQSSPSIDSIFFAALEKNTTEERASLLDKACGDDAELRRRVERLLAAHPQAAGSFLESPPSGLAETEVRASSESAGATIGPYKLLQEIGEGGMGTVFLAEQMRPVKRRVAVKIIKQGMDTRQFVARFEAERQALAMMDHPNIARVLDAGCTETGRPYFVMELVKGVPITKFCDENRLTARQRLELFVPVCHAVQHAHQKGIIHRDLKPSNVLVALYDDRPVPKVIDFGVAKATSQQLTEKTLFTQLGQIVGTWEYMSPEQAVLNQLDVDTRTDIYSLGVLLYELLTGVTPLESHRLRCATLEEALRLIREEEPPKPSTRISSLGEIATATAAYRGTNTTSLAKTVRGDLDWIVMKALEKNRPRRYETANGLAADLQRYLNGEPIEARPPSAVYRLRKTVLRHRVALATTTVIALTLIAATTMSSWFFWRERQERQRTQALLAELWEELADRALDASFSGDLRQARDAIGKARTAGAPDDLLQTLDGLALFFSGRNLEAIARLEKTIIDNPNSLSALSALWWAYRHAGRGDRLCEVETALAEQEWSPRSDYETLLLCLSQAVQGPPEKTKKVIERLDKLIAQRSRWGTAYAIRASARMEYAMESKNLEDFRKAVADFEASERLLPDCPFVDAMGLYVVTTALEFAEHLPSDADATQWRHQGEKLAAKLSDRPTELEGRSRAANFCYSTGQVKLAKKLEAELVRPEQPYGLGGLAPWAALLFRERTPNLENRLREELARADAPTPRADAQTFLAIVLAEKSAEGRKEAMEYFRDLEKQKLPDPYLLQALDIPLVLGRFDEGKRLIHHLLRSNFLTRQWRWYSYVIEYHSGEMTEDDLIDRAGPFSNARCMAHYAIAMKSLSFGDREKAEQHFEQAAATGQPGWQPYHWAQAYLQRMQEDPAWPNWIPVKKSEEVHGGASPSSCPR